MARTTIPATFQASVAYSSAKPRRSKAFRSGSVTATSTSVPAEPRPRSENPGGDGGAHPDQDEAADDFSLVSGAGAEPAAEFQPGQ